MEIILPGNVSWHNHSYIFILFNFRLWQFGQQRNDPHGLPVLPSPSVKQQTTWNRSRDRVKSITWLVNNPKARDTTPYHVTFLAAANHFSILIDKWTKKTRLFTSFEYICDKFIPLIVTTIFNYYWFCQQNREKVYSILFSFLLICHIVARNENLCHCYCVLFFTL